MLYQTNQHLSSEPSGAVALLRYAQRMHRSAQSEGAKRLFALYAVQAIRRLQALSNLPPTDSIQPQQRVQP